MIVTVRQWIPWSECPPECEAPKASPKLETRPESKGILAHWEQLLAKQVDLMFSQGMRS
jgi:hypothetical protein